MTIKTGNALALLIGIVLSTTGCAEPTWQFPGGTLKGEERMLDMQSAVPGGGVIQLETNPDTPYSVNVGYVLIEGKMYIDPEESRTWYQNIKSNPAVRLRFDGQPFVHPALAVAETDSAILAMFEEGRHVLRLDAREK